MKRVPTAFFGKPAPQEPEASTAALQQQQPRPPPVETVTMVPDDMDMSIGSLLDSVCNSTPKPPRSPVKKTMDGEAKKGEHLNDRERMCQLKRSEKANKARISRPAATAGLSSLAAAAASVQAGGDNGADDASFARRVDQIQAEFQQYREESDRFFNNLEPTTNEEKQDEYLYEEL